MSSKITKYALCLMLCVFNITPTNAQFDIDWGGLLSSAIDEGTRSEVQNIFASLSNLNFSDSKLSMYRKSASALGLSQPTTVAALMKFEQGIRPFAVSSLPTLSDLRLNSLGNGSFNEYSVGILNQCILSLKKDKLEDYLTQKTIDEVRRIDVDGLFASRLLQSMNPQLALLLNNHPDCLEVLRDKPVLLDYGDISIITYVFQKAYSHAKYFKKSPISNPSEWDISIHNDSIVLISHQNVVLARIVSTSAAAQGSNSVNINLGENPALLNYELPGPAIIDFTGVSYITDRLGRITEVRFQPFKRTIKLSGKNKMKVKDILSAREESDRKPYLLIPKNYGGTETWSNVMSYADTKENKTSIKNLNKRIDEIAKLDGSPIIVRLNYNSSSSQPSSVQYFNGETLLGTVK